MAIEIKAIKDCINISYYERYDEVHYQIFNGIKKHFFHSILDGIVRVEMGFLKLFAVTFTIAFLKI